MEMWAATGRTCGVGEAWHPVPTPLKDWLCLLDIKLSPPEQKRLGMTATELSLSQPLWADRLVVRERLPFSLPLRCLGAPETAPFPLFPPQSALPPLCCFLSALSAHPLSSFTWRPSQGTGEQDWKERAASKGLGRWGSCCIWMGPGGEHISQPLPKGHRACGQDVPLW